MTARVDHCWSMDLVSDKLADGRSFRILTVLDQFTRECVCLEADRSMTGMKVAQGDFEDIVQSMGVGEAICTMREVIAVVNRPQNIEDEEAMSFFGGKESDAD